MVGVLSGLMVCSAVFAHAIGESRAFANATSSQNPRDFTRDFARDLYAKDSDPLWLVSCFAFVAFEAVAVTCAFTSEGLSAPLAGVAAGLVACLAGVRIRCLAIARLGPDFARAPRQGPAPVLAQDSIFAVVRHPSELGLLLFCAGLVVTVPAVGVICAFLLLIVPFVALRIAREERWLGTHDEIQHADFRAAVPRLLCPRPQDLFALIALLLEGPPATAVEGVKTGQTAASDARG
jgi:protein-S-isoprenylcysteine O-methyltransferase Ste14